MHDAIKQIRTFCPVTDEQYNHLRQYSDLLLKWNSRINLIGKTTVSDCWSRHIIDSAQLMKYIPADTKTLTDFGSGAGLPGIVLAILGVPEVYLIESNGKKASFLQEAGRITDSNIHIHNERAECLTPWKSDVITARAFAEMDKLLNHIFPFSQKESLCLLLKGCRAREELDSARAEWGFDATLYPSAVSNNKGQGFIVALENLDKKHES